MRLTELETEYENYRTKTQTEIIEARDKTETLQAKLDSQPNFEQLVAQLKKAQFDLAEKDAELEKVRADHKEQL